MRARSKIHQSTMTPILTNDPFQHSLPNPHQYLEAPAVTHVKSPFLSRSQKKTLSKIEETPIKETKSFENPPKSSFSALLRMKEMFQFKAKTKENDYESDKKKQFNEISKIMKGNHDIYFQKTKEDEFSSDYKLHYERQYNKQKAQYKPTYYLDVIEFSSLEKAREFSDNFPCFKLRKKLMLFKANSSKLCEILTENSFFKAFTMFLIWFNTFIFTLMKLRVINEYMDSVFYRIILIIFFIEILIKITAKGLIFFKGWVNSIDFIIVFLAFFLNFFIEKQEKEQEILSSLIIIRPLTTIVFFANFHLIANAISSAIPLLKESLMILMFFLLIFTISGLHLFSGYLKKRCFSKETGLLKLSKGFETHLCEDDSFCEFEGFLKEFFICGKIIENPNWDVTSFDTFFEAFLVVFQTCTLAGWNDIMIYVQETFSVYSALYFVFLVIFGALILLNLILAVLKMKFSEYKEEFMKGMKENYNKRRYSFEKLKKLKIFIGNQGKKKLLMGKSQSVLSKIKGLVKFKGNRPKLLELINRNIENKEENSVKKEEFTNKNKNNDVNNEEIQSKKLLNPIENPVKKADLSKKTQFNLKNLKFMPINIEKTHKKPLSNPLTLNSEAPLITMDPEDFFIDRHVNELFQELDCKIADLLKKPLEKHREMTKIPVFDAFITIKDLENDFKEKISKKKSPISPFIEKSEEKPDKFERAFPKKSQIVPSLIKIEPMVDNALFTRLSHGFSFVKDSLNLQKIDKNLKNNEIYEGEIPEISDFDLDYEDPELPILKTLNPKHLKLEPNNPKPYESTSISDILPQAKLKSHCNPLKTPKRSPPSLTYSLNFSRKFYKENIEIPSKMPNNERNLTRLLLAGQTLKKLNRLKLPLFLSLDTEFLKKQLFLPELTINNQNEGYFFKAQQLIRSEKALKTSKIATKNRNLKKKETILTINQTFKEKDIKEIKRIYFGESEFMKLGFSEENISSSDEDEVEKAIETAFSDQNQVPNPFLSHNLMLNLKLEHIIQSKRENLSEIDEIRRIRVFKKARVKQEFDFAEKHKRFFSEDQGILKKNNQKIQVYWSGEEVFGYSQGFYQYSSEGMHLLKRMKKILNSLNYTRKNYDIWESGLMGKWNSLRKSMRFLVLSKNFMKIMLFFVFFNTIILSINGVIQLTPSDSSRLITLNIVFTMIFTVEVLLKLIGLGIIGYFNDKFNILDCFIVVISLVEFIIIQDKKSSFQLLGFFKTIRILRVLRLLQSFKYANVLAEKIGDSLQNCLKIALILLVFLYIYALLGMAIYQGNFEFEEIRQNFETFPNALIIVFQLITINNWNMILYGCLRTPISKVFSMIYLSSAVFIGNYLLLNLLLAILLDVFAKDSSIELNFLLDSQEIGEDLDEEREKKLLENLVSSNKAEKEEEDHQKNLRRFLRKFTRNFKEIGESSSPTMNSDLPSSDPLKLLETEPCEFSYYFFSSTNKLRIFCHKLLKTSAFQLFCQIFILLSMVQLVFYTYVYDDSKGKKASSMVIVSFTLDCLILGFFLIEFILQTILHGFFEHWKKPWGRLNTIILLYSLVIFFLEILKTLFSLQTYIRPLRIIVVLRAFSYNEKYRGMASALLHSVKAILNLVLMILLIWLMFSIIGVSFLQDKMGFCEVEHHYDVNKSTCEEILHAEWKITHYNFDNVLNGLLTLFVLSFFEGFPAIVYKFMDAGDQETGPSENNSEYLMIFFVVYVVVSAIFLMNLFICVIFMNYIIAEKRQKNHFLTEEQYRWIAIQRLLIKETPDYSYIKRPDSSLRLFFYNLTKTRFFEHFIFLCIILNTVVMAVYYEGCPIAYEATLKNINLSITIIFIVEASLKLMALGFGGYFYSGWNKLDFFVVLTSIFDICTEFIAENDFHIGFEILRGLRILKVARLLRLIKSYSGLQKLFLTSVYSLPFVWNAFVILFLVYFMFTVLSVFLFRNIT